MHIHASCGVPGSVEQFALQTRCSNQPEELSSALGCPEQGQPGASQEPFPGQTLLPAGAWLAVGRSQPLPQVGSGIGGGKIISAFRELRFGVLSSQPCVRNGIREEVKEGTHQGVTLFNKPRGIAGKGQVFECLC